MAVITKLIYGFTLSKPQLTSLEKLISLIPKVPMESQGDQEKRQNNLEKRKKKIGEFILFDFLTCADSAFFEDIIVFITN